jgi:hypothetical protein
MNPKIGDKVKYSKFVTIGEGTIESEFSEDIWIINGKQCWKSDVTSIVLTKEKKMYTRKEMKIALKKAWKDSKEKCQSFDLQ